MIYLDHNATTPIAPEVREAMRALPPFQVLIFLPQRSTRNAKERREGLTTKYSNYTKKSQALPEEWGNPSSRCRFGSKLKG
jgi:cysteine sulfinate desulfinase/cysteine desulfurase-like protein